MQLVSAAFLAAFPLRVINVHPALLPAFPGIRAVEQALDYGVKVFGVTVHFVDEGIDSGPIILQQAVELPEAVDAAEVREALRPIEHELLTGAVRLIASGTVRPDQPIRGAYWSEDALMSAPGIVRDSMEAMVQPGEVRVQRALLSVSDKTGIVEFARGLASLGVELLSTGGTATALREGGLEVRAVEDFTGFPEIMGGRVKTLHPKIYAGLLALRDNEEHMAAATEHEVEFVDLVCVNLYPFEQTAARRGATDHEMIENIDIGGPTMIRAAAKNFAFTAVVVNPASYDAVLQELKDAGGKLSLGTRESLAAEAFSYTARYDSAISRWFVEKQDDFPPLLLNAFEKVTDLAYGENPHQRAAYYARPARACTCSRWCASSAARSCRSTTCST